MPSVISAGTTTGTALSLTSDTSGELQIKTNNGSTTALTLTTGGNLNIPTLGARITGDFSASPVSNRVAFQTSTTDGSTTVAAIPNGTSTLSVLRAYAASDLTNATYGDLVVQSTTVDLRSTRHGTGTYVPLTFQTGGSESLRLSATAKTLILAGGSTSANGTGITFPAPQSASSDANTLDDYEEGLWTPVINGGYTTSRNISAGTYVKVGSLVYVHCQLDLTTSNSGSGAFFISGLPFTSFNTNNHGQALALGALFNWNINNSAYQIGARVNDSSASIYFWNNIDASSDDLLVAPFGNGVTVYGSISGCYRAAS
jgi:hypothetical protein